MSAVRNDGIWQNGMSRLRAAMAAGQAADTQAYLQRMTIDKLDQGAVIISVDMKITLLPAVRASLCTWLKMLHVVIKNRFSGSFFPDKLAINQVLSYHGNAIRTMLFLE